MSCPLSAELCHQPWSPWSVLLFYGLHLSLRKIAAVIWQILGKWQFFCSFVFLIYKKINTFEIKENKIGGKNWKKGIQNFKNTIFKELSFGFFLTKMAFWQFLNKNDNFLAIFEKKWHFAGTFWTFKWQFSGGSGLHSYFFKEVLWWKF